jgi:hypothetical protein
VSVRKRNGKRAHVSRAAQLEAKLEDLVTLLRHQAAPGDKVPSPADTVGNATTATPALSSQSTTSQSETSSPLSATTAALPSQKPDGAPGGARPAPLTHGSLPGSAFDPPVTASNPPISPIEPPSVPPCIYQPTPLEAAEDLLTFRKYMLIFLPFVHLPTTITSEKLKESSPFLWFSVMTVTCKNVDRRLAMSEAVKKFVAQKMILEHEKSLDLLFGLLVIMGW